MRSIPSRVLVGALPLWLLLGQLVQPVQCYGTSGHEVVLLDTTTTTSELNWRRWHSGSYLEGWTPETMPIKENGTNRNVFRVCDQEVGSESWLLIPRLDARGASHLKIELEFSVGKCSASSPASCVETLKLYIATLSQSEDLQEEWQWDERWKQVDVIVPKLHGERTNFHTGHYKVPATTPYVHFAFKDTGACFALLALRIYAVHTDRVGGAAALASGSHRSFVGSWVWLLLALAFITLVLCLLFFLAKKSCRSHRVTQSTANGKTTALPLYTHAGGGNDASAVLGKFGTTPQTTASGGSKRKANVPLLIPVGPVQQSPTSQLSRHFRPYVNPKTYEDPTEALAQFTNEIPAHLIEVTRVIGAGEFGEVCCGRLTAMDTYGNTQQQIVAVKILHSGGSQKARDNFLVEAMIMGQFDHENVVRLIGVVSRAEPAMIVTEYMLNGSLDKFLSSNIGRIEIYHLVKMLHGIASGMQYLTEQKYFVHRDLAARNILVDDRLTCKIADFGLSREMSTPLSSPVEPQYAMGSGGKIPIRWTAPEAISSNTYTAFSDVWSYGIVMWEVFSFGKRPYGDWSNRKVMEEVAAGYRLTNPMETMDSPDRLYNLNREHGVLLYKLMLDCWKAEASKRPAFSSLVSRLNAFKGELEAEMNAANFGLKSIPHS